MSNERTREDIPQHLRNSQLLAGLSEDAIRAMADAMTPEEFATGELIIRQGEPGRCFYLITAGRVQVEVKFDGGSSVPVATLGPGDCIGEMSLLSGDATSADVAALEETHTLALGRQSFDALVDAHPSLLREFVRLLSRRLSATDMAVKEARADEKALAQFLRETGFGPHRELIGKHAMIAALRREVDKQSKSRAPLLIFGERGTGKELLARLIHTHGRHSEAPLVSVECRDIRETPWGDNLFGRYQLENDGCVRAHGICYLALAAGGTILLKDIQSLPPLIQARLALFLSQQAPGRGTAGTELRFIATASGDLSALAGAGKFSTALSEAFAANSFSVPALRSRKRDIPELADHFILEYCRRQDIPVKRLTDQALTRLVSYDYEIANVRELEEALDRAAVLADGDTIEAEEIFLGPPAKAHKTGINLLALKAFMVRKTLVLLPKILRPLAAATFAFVLYQCFFGVPRGAGNLGTTITWALWWPALAFSFFFIGRLWCAVCPMALAGSWAQRLLNFKRTVPAWVKNYDVYIGLTGFVVILWLEEATRMRNSPLATGALLASIIAGAVAAGLLYPRRTWCRHICPMGTFAGLCSSSALLELRPTPDICSAKCTGHTCYKGDGRIDGCPVFNHLMFVESNQNCILCMNCVQSCPHDSPQLNLRWPAVELWIMSKVEVNAGRFLGVLLAQLGVLSFIQQWDLNPRAARPAWFESHRVLFLSGAMLLAAALPLAILWVRERLQASAATGQARDLFWRKVLAWGPLVTAGFVCYQLAYIPGIRDLQIALGFRPPQIAATLAFGVSLLGVLRVVIMAAGLLTTFGLVWRISSGPASGGSGNRLKGYRMNLLGAAAYAAVLLVLMTKPEWLGIL